MMETSQQNETAGRQLPLRLPVTAPAAAVTVLGIGVAAVACGLGRYWEAGGVAAITLTLVAVISGRVSVTGLVIVWFATTPLASFYVRVPGDRALITYDRAFFAMVALWLIWRWVAAKRRGAESHRSEGREQGSKTPLADCASDTPPLLSALSFQIAWALLAVMATVSAFVSSNNLGYALRLAVDSFWLPLVAFHLSRYRFDLASRGRMLMLAAVALSFFLLATGVFELATGTDLFQYKGSELMREGELRVNGPFASDSSYAIICALLFLFLRAAPRLLRIRLDNSARLLWWLALAASLAASLLSMFRTVAVAVVVSWAMFEVLTRHRSRRPYANLGVKRSRRRRWAMTGIVTGAVGVMTLILLSPFIGPRLTSVRNVYGRLATWKAAAKISLENPAMGVGLGNYTDYFRAKYSMGGDVQESVGDVRAASAPHNNLFWIAAELGLVGLALFLLAHVQVFLMGYHSLRRAESPQLRIAAACLIALFAVYWIPGFTLTSGVHSDLNLYFFFFLGLMSLAATPRGVGSTFDVLRTQVSPTWQAIP